MILTHELMEAGRSNSGAFNLSQLRALGVELPEKGWPASGWPRKLLGKEISQERYDAFISLRGNKRERAARAEVNTTISEPEIFKIEPTKSKNDHKPMNFHTPNAEAFANALYEKSHRDLS